MPPKMVMDVDEMVDAALAGLDQGEQITIPSLPDIADRAAFEAARRNLIPKLSLSSPAPCYSGLLALVLVRHDREAIAQFSGTMLQGSSFDSSRRWLNVRR